MVHQEGRAGSFRGQEFDPPPTRPDPEPNPLQETNLPPPIVQDSPVLVTFTSPEAIGPNTGQ